MSDDEEPISPPTPPSGPPPDHWRWELEPGGQDPTASGFTPRNRYAWALAVSPLPIISAAVFLNGSGSDLRTAILGAAGFVIAAGLAAGDAAEVRAAGGRMDRMLAILLAALAGVIYLIVRAVRVRRGYLLPVAWCVATGSAVVGLGFVVPYTQPPAFSVAAVEQGILATYASSLGAGATASCPGHTALQVGEVAHCSAATTTTGGTLLIDATIIDDDGRVSLVVVR